MKTEKISKQYCLRTHTGHHVTFLFTVEPCYNLETLLIFKLCSIDEELITGISYKFEYSSDSESDMENFINDIRYKLESICKINMIPVKDNDIYYFVEGYNSVSLVTYDEGIENTIYCITINEEDASNYNIYYSMNNVTVQLYPRAVEGITTQDVMDDANN